MKTNFYIMLSNIYIVTLNVAKMSSDNFLNFINYIILSVVQFPLDVSAKKVGISKKTLDDYLS